MKDKLLSIIKSKIWFLLFFIVLGFIAPKILIRVLAGPKLNLRCLTYFPQSRAHFWGSLLVFVRSL